MIEIVAGIIILLGGAFCVVAGIGIIRMPDVYIRMHAATKVGTLGSGLTLAAAAVFFGLPDVIFKVVLTVLFLLLTAPIGAHMVGRAALRIGMVPWKPDDMKQREAAASEVVKPDI